MISRRAFMQGLAMLAAGVDAGSAATVAKPPLTTEPLALVMPADIVEWTPETAAVTDWLAWYKAWVVGQFPDVKTMFPRADVIWRYTAENGDVHEHAVTEAIDEHPEDMMIGVHEFELALTKLESTRIAVGWSQGLGYETGRRGAPRACRSYSGPCNEGFAWHNGWMTGHLDYERREGRGPAPVYGQGVFFPEGHPQHAAWKALQAKRNA